MINLISDLSMNRKRDNMDSADSLYHPISNIYNNLSKKHYWNKQIYSLINKFYQNKQISQHDLQSVLLKRLKNYS
jgi:hypothetical protein